MKIIAVKIYGFGKWSDVSFDLNKKLKFIYGNNEAGKTTLRVFITSILFGFATKRKPFEQYHPKNGSRYGGCLKVETIDGEFIIERIEGGHGGKLKITNVQTGQLYPETFLEKWLGPVTLKLFNEIYCFDQDSLHQIGLLEPEELEKSLLSVGTSGSQKVFEIQEKFQKKADELYKPNGRVPILNKLLKQYKQKKKEVDEVRSKTSLFSEFTLDIQNEAKSKQKLEEEIKKYENELLKMQKAKSLWSAYSQYQALNKQKKSNSFDMKVTEEDYQVVAEAKLAIDSEKKMLQLVEDKINSLVGDNQKIESDDLSYFKLHEDEFSNVFQMLDRVSGSIERIKQLRSQLATLEEERNQLIEKNSWEDKTIQAFSRMDIKRLLFLLKQNTREVENDTQLVRRRPKTKSVKSEYSFTLWGGCAALLFLIGALIIPSGMMKSAFIGCFLITGIVLLSKYFSRIQNGGNNFENVGTNTAEITKILEEAGCQLSLNYLQTKQIDLNHWFELTEKVNECRLNVAEKEKQLVAIKEQTFFCEKKLVLSADSLQRVEQLQAYKRRISPLLREQQGHSRMIASYEEEKKKRIYKIKVLSSELHKKITAYGKNSITDFERDYAAQKEHFEDNIKLTNLESQIDSQTMGILDNKRNLSNLEADYETILETLESERKELKRIVTDITEKKVRLEQLGQYDKLQVMEQELTNLQTEIIEQSENWVAFNATKQWLKRILELSSQNNLPEVVRLAEKYFMRLTNHHFEKILLSKGHLKLVSNNKINYDVGELSRATTEQLYIALRFAFIAKANKKYRLPLIVDDAFVNFDKKRKESMFALLQEISNKTQILCFTVDIEPFYDKVNEEEVLMIG